MTRAGSRPGLAFLVVGVLAGLFELVAVPPFQVPDETRHLLQSYRVSEGRLFPKRVRGMTGDYLPRSLGRLVEVLPERRGFRDYPAERFAKANRIELRAGSKLFYPLGTVAVYSPVPYLPQALAIGLLRPFDVRPLALVYAGRLANLAAALALTWLAIHLAPFHRWAFCILALTPMAVFERSSLSSDALTNAFAFLLTALTLRAAVTGRWGAREVVAIGVVGTALALSKIGYLLLALLALMIPRRSDQGAASYLGQQAVMVALPVLVGVAWAAAVESFFAVPWADYRGVQYDALAHTLAHPVEFGGRLLDLLVRCWDRQLWMFMGALGLADIFLPRWLITGGYVAVLLAFVSESSVRGFGLRQRAVAALAATAAYATVCFIFAVTVLRAAEPLCRIQGRYWIPLAPALVAAFALPRIPEPVRRLRTPVLALALMVGVLGVSGTVIVTRYYGAAGP
jgi:hypothetical protein